MRNLIILVTFFSFKSFSQTDNNNVFFFGRLMDNFGSYIIPIANAEIKLIGSKINTMSDLNGYFSLRIPNDTLKRKNRFIFEFDNANYENDTITLSNLNSNQILNFSIRQKNPIIDPYNYEDVIQRCQYEQMIASDSLVYFIYGFIQESKTKYNLTGINIAIKDEKGSYLVGPNCCVSENGFYSYKIPRKNIYGKNCTITYSAINFETITKQFLFKEKYILQNNVLMNYLNTNILSKKGK